MQQADTIRIVQAVAGHVIGTVRSAGLEPLVITADDAVSRWAAALGARIIPEPETGGLDTAARLVAERAQQAGARWAILHSDLPYLTKGDVEAFYQEPAAICPSYDGGTSLLLGTAPTFPFSYGPGSFSRHLRAGRGTLTVLSRPGLACDIDDALDLVVARRRLAWLEAALNGD